MAWVSGSIIVGFVAFGVTLASLLFKQDIYLSSQITVFLGFMTVFLPLGMMTSTSLMQNLNARAEKTFGSDDFNETYKRYAQSKRKRNTNFRWYDAKDYHDWREETYRKAAGGFHQQDRRQESRHGQAEPSRYSMSEKDKMFAALELSNQNATAKDIKTAYRKLARQYHPDVLASQGLSDAELDVAMKQMQAVNAAYDWLEDNGYA